MKNILIALCSLFVTFSANAQKDKIKFTAFNSNNGVIVVFKSGTVALYSNPELDLIKEVTPADKKNNASMVAMSPSQKYLIVLDSRVKKWIFYEASSLNEIGRMDKPMSYWSLPMFVGNDQFFSEKKIHRLEDLSVDLDLTDHASKHEGYAFSPSLKYYINYEIDETGGDGDFEVFETETKKPLGNSKLGESSTKSDFVITLGTHFIDEDTIKITYKKYFMEQQDYEWKVPTQLGVDSFNFDRPTSKYVSKSGLFIDYQNRWVVSGNYAIDASVDYTFIGINANRVASKNNDFIVISTPKNIINLYRNDPTQTELLGDYKKATLLKSIEIPAEK